MTAPSTATVLILIGFSILLFLALREVVCWYYKINKMVDNQAKQIDLLQQIVKKLSGDSGE